MLGVLAEGGAELASSLLDAGLVDRVAFFLAPRLLGGRSRARPGGRRRSPCFRSAVGLREVTTRRVGEDLLVEADVAA